MKRKAMMCMMAAYFPGSMTARAAPEVTPDGTAEMCSFLEMG